MLYLCILATRPRYHCTNTRCAIIASSNMSSVTAGEVWVSTLFRHNLSLEPTHNQYGGLAQGLMMINLAAPDDVLGKRSGKHKLGQGGVLLLKRAKTATTASIDEYARQSLHGLLGLVTAPDCLESPTHLQIGESSSLRLRRRLFRLVWSC